MQRSHLLAPARLALISIALVGLVSSARAQKEEKKGPDPKKVEATLTDLKKGMAQREVPLRIQALNRAAEVEHEKVIDLIAKEGLRDKDMEVVRYSVDVLGLMQHDEARLALESFLKRNKRIREDPEAFAGLVRAIGRHANPKSITPLTKDLFAVREREVVQARILALGNIRDPKSVKELFGLMTSVDRRKLNPHMDELRMSLMILTGVDKGESPERWIDWWNDNKKKIEVSSKAPKLPQQMQRRWDRFWGNEQMYERAKKRGDRGNDPEDDGDRE